MSRTGDTKKRIIDRLSSKNQTLTEISEALELAPSTVSQHLKELVESGAIRQVGDGQRKWKYYGLNNNQTLNNPREQDFHIKSFFIPIAAIVVIALIGFVLYAGTGSKVVAAQQIYLSPGSKATNGSTVFSVSDAPQSYNITALYITVSNMSIRSSTGTWYKIPLQKQTFNLVSLNNISAILSSVKLKPGYYDALVLYTTNVSAIVNGTLEPVILPTSKVYILEPFNISNSTATNWVNIDFNLSSSIHILGNGSLIMMPVIALRHSIDMDMVLGANSILQAGAPPMPLWQHRFGMDYNGLMEGNFTCPNDVDIGMQDGHFMPMMDGNSTFAFRMPHGMFIGRGPIGAIGSGIWRHIDGGDIENTPLPPQPNSSAGVAQPWR